MTKINFVRLIIGTVIAAVILFVTDGLIHEYLVKQYWEYLYQGLGARPPQGGHAMTMVYFAIYEIGRAFTAILVYVLMRPFYGAGPKTAVISAVVAWLAFSVAAPAEFIPLGFYGRRMWVMVAAAQLVTSIAANLLAAWTYSDAVATLTPVAD